jgi:hypothetical protein
MTQESEEDSWRVVSLVTDRKTTASFKRTINAAILLRAARNPPSSTTSPRKAPHMMTFLGLVELQLFVGQHEQLLRSLIHHLPL